VRFVFEALTVGAIVDLKKVWLLDRQDLVQDLQPFLTNVLI
jgi:hypothetical protein